MTFQDKYFIYYYFVLIKYVFNNKVVCIKAKCLYYLNYNMN